MRILLTIAPGVHNLEIYRITGMKAPPLGLASIAAVLEQNGHEVRIVDSPTLELEMDEWMREVKSWRPDVIGFSVLTPWLPRPTKLLSGLRRRCQMSP